MPSHLLRCQGIAVGNYSFTLGRLEAGAPSTLAHLGLRNPAIKKTFENQHFFPKVSGFGAIILHFTFPWDDFTLNETHEEIEHIGNRTNDNNAHNNDIGN